MRTAAESCCSCCGRPLQAVYTFSDSARLGLRQFWLPLFTKQKIWLVPYSPLANAVLAEVTECSDSQGSLRLDSVSGSLHVHQTSAQQLLAPSLRCKSFIAG